MKFILLVFIFIAIASVEGSGCKKKGNCRTTAKEILECGEESCDWVSFTYISFNL